MNIWEYRARILADAVALHEAKGSAHEDGQLVRGVCIACMKESRQRIGKRT